MDKKLEDELGSILNRGSKRKRSLTALTQKMDSFRWQKYLKIILLSMCLLVFIGLLLRLGPVGIRFLPLISIVSLILYASRGFIKRFWRSIP